MAILETDESNILDAETINWRWIVYPLLAVAILTVGGFGYYYYELHQRDVFEANAREALLQAKTPEEFIKVADQFPGADQSTLALMSAGRSSFDKRDFPAAEKAYQRIIDMTDVDPQLRDSAQLGLGSSLEGAGKTDDAINAFLEVAHQGDKSPFAPYAYSTVARIYDQRGDKTNEREILTEIASLDPDSSFVKEAQDKLKSLNAAAPPAPGPTSPAPVNITPAPVPPTN